MLKKRPSAEGCAASWRGDGVVTGGLLLFTAWLYFWCALQPASDWFARGPSGYYGLQADGFRKGQLNMTLDPHPALLAMADPYDPVANAPYRAHDMTLYQGKYYMYFGPAPTVLFFWPVAALTGYFATEPLAVALFAFVGFAAGWGLLLAFRRRYAPRIAPYWLALVGVAWALGTYVVGILHHPGFYQVPISCAFMLLMLGLVGVYRSVHAETGKSAGWGLLWAGICLGLCLGCRPNYLLAPLGLAVPWAWAIWRWRAPPVGNIKRAVIFGLLAFGPVLLAGFAVLAHNYARFGNPLEFGMRLQLAGERMENIVLLSPGFIMRNLPGYLLSHGWWWPYFPYLTHTPMAPLGGLRYFPLGFLGVLALCFNLRGSSAPRVVLALTVLAMGVINVLMLSSFYWMTDRYTVDYLPCLILAGGLGALLAFEHVSRWAAWTRVAVGTVLVLTALNGALLILADSPARTRQWAALEFNFNRLSMGWMQATGKTPGMLRFQVVFPSSRPGEVDPLVESGLSAGQRDALTVEQQEDGRIKFRFFHAGLGGPVSGPVTVKPGQAYLLEVLYGGLLPPARHPYFAGWTEQEIAAARSKLLVRLDGQPVLEASLAAYDSRPWDVHLGWSAYASGSLAERFRGRLELVSVERLQRDDFRPPILPPHEAARIKLRFPVDRTGQSEPLLATGAPGDGELIYVQYTAPGRLRFGVDRYGAGGPFTPETSYDPAQSHEVLLWMGSWARSEDGKKQGSVDEVPAGRRLFLAFNGEVLLDHAHPFRATTVLETAIGRNAHGSTAARGLFSGQLLELAGVAYDALPVPPPSSQTGAVVMSVQFPAARTGASEPLVTTGKTGAGNLVYVRYLDEKHVLFGFDHWGIGGLLSDPVEIEYGRTYRLEISLGSLYDGRSPDQEATGAELLGTVWVKLDDKVVLTGASPCHPSRLDEIRIGTNEIGGSTAGGTFYGTVLALSRDKRPVIPPSGRAQP